MLTSTTGLDVVTRVGRALADENRARILLNLLDAPGYPAEIARELDLSRTNVSNHLACLRGCGLVVAEPEGRRTRYEVADPHLSIALRAALDAVLAIDQGAACIDEGCPLGCCTSEGATIEADR